MKIMPRAADVIHALGLSPHPEGGWYRETWRGPRGSDGRAIGTAILFLLESGQRSHWHRVDAAEIWFWHGGAPLRLMTAAADEGPICSVTLGPDILDGQAVQGIVPADYWQAAELVEETDKGWSLVSCTVTPGFDFAGFTLADPGWAPSES